jgi:glyoxylate reductase
MSTLVTTLELPSAATQLLGELGTVVGPAAWADALPDAEGLIALLTVRIDEALLARAPRLRIVANAAVGVDNVDLAACAARRVMVTNTPDVLTEASADLTLALLLAIVRRLPQAETSLRAGEFHGWRFWDFLGGDIQGRTLGIFGMGRIGRAVARRAVAFGMRVQYTSRTRLPESEERALAATAVDWEALLGTSDVLTLHAPLTPETRHLLNRESLARMKPGSYLVNTARGPLVDEEALVSALRDGPLAGAGLDVYEHEPHVTPGLLSLPNVVLLPHIGSATRETRTRMAMLAARNVHAFLRGEAALTPVATR